MQFQAVASDKGRSAAHTRKVDFHTGTHAGQDTAVAQLLCARRARRTAKLASSAARMARASRATSASPHAARCASAKVTAGSGTCAGSAASHAHSGGVRAPRACALRRSRASPLRPALARQVSAAPHDCDTVVCAASEFARRRLGPCPAAGHGSAASQDHQHECDGEYRLCMPGALQGAPDHMADKLYCTGSAGAHCALVQSRS